MASAKSGLLPARCSDCEKEPAQKEFWGCVRPLKEPLILDECGLGEYEFYNCPIKFITWNTAEWLSKYEYWQESKKYPDYEKLSVRDIDAWETFKSALNECMIIKKASKNG